MGIFTKEVVFATPASVSVLTPLTGWLSPERGTWDVLVFWCVFQNFHGRLVVETSEDGISVDAQEFHVAAAGPTEVQCSVTIRDSPRRYFRVQGYAQNSIAQPVSFGVVGAQRT